MFNKKLMLPTTAFSFLIFAQAVIYGAVAYYFYLTKGHTLYLGILNLKEFTVAILILGVLLSLLTIHIIKALIFVADTESRAEVAVARLHNNKEMVDLLRAQRHDVINHFQVIYGLIQLGKTEAADEYISQIKKELV